ncbi:MAG: hypothetical protein IJX46_07230 [Clostridia bacterium]|nr:hypothetical protein [Clostridia bacterium]
MHTFISDTLELTASTESGNIIGIRVLGDTSGMDWVLENSEWGQVERFGTQSVTLEGGRLITVARHESGKLGLTVERFVEDGKYTEVYRVKNLIDLDCFVTPDDFGIFFPFDCKMIRANITEQFVKKCTAHVWCGENTSWIYGAKIGGKPPYLVAHLTEGSMSEYSIHRDLSMTRSCSDYRGIILMNPAPASILAGEEAIYKFVYEATDKHPRDYLREETDAICIESDKFSVFEGEPTVLDVYCRRGVEGLTAVCGREALPTETVSPTHARVTFASDKIGEYTVRVSTGGKTTVARINVLLPLGELLERRAHFIAEKQQYHKAGSPLDGAYLVYDRDLESVHYDGWTDCNSCRERVVMGIIVAKQLQRKFDQGLYDSLMKYIEFIEREIFNTETMFVEGGLRKYGLPRRGYNEPWISLLYRELYEVTHDNRHLDYSARVLIEFFKFWGVLYGGCCVEPNETAVILRRNGMNEYADALDTYAKDHADVLLRNRYEATGYTETGYEHETPNGRGFALFNHYTVSKDEKYLDLAHDNVVSASSFYAFQPDFHFNRISVRHWDCYWFGKRKIYGDTMPHYWSARAAKMYNAMDIALGTDHSVLIRQILLGNLCLYREDGFASNNYLAPYVVNDFVPEGKLTGSTHTEVRGRFRGKEKDAFANDQDWALYYAIRILDEKSPLKD